MKVIYHIGLHCTDEDAALRCLLNNADALAAAGTVVAVPGRFRPVLREALLSLRGAVATEEMQERVLDAVMDQDAPERLIFSHDSFLCIASRAVAGPFVYPQAGERAQWIANLLPDHEAEFAFALRNPATYLPALHNRFSTEMGFAEFLDRIDPEALSWADMVERIRTAVPECPLTIWCNEDTPMIWPDVLQALSGIGEGDVLEGLYDFHASIMTREGLFRMAHYLEGHPPKTAEQRRRIVAAFLDKYAIEEAVEEEFDLPGWTEDKITRLTEAYERDVERVAAMDGVTFLSA